MLTRIYHKNNASIYVAPLSGKRKEIIISVSNDPRLHQHILPSLDYDAITGAGNLQGLLAVRRALPGVVKWIKSIGYIPVADPADPRRRSAFGSTMERLGIQYY